MPSKLVPVLRLVFPRTGEITWNHAQEAPSERWIVATDSLKRRERSGLAFAARAKDNGRDRSVFLWRDRVLP